MTSTFHINKLQNPCMPSRQYLPHVFLKWFQSDSKYNMASDWQRHFLNSSPELLHLKSLHLAEMFIWESSRIYVTFQNDFDIQDGHPYLIGRNMLNPPLPNLFTWSHYIWLMWCSKGSKEVVLLLEYCKIQ
jgi:hypothetical protein